MRMKASMVLVVLSCAITLNGSPQEATSDAVIRQTKKLLDVFGGDWSVIETYDPSDSVPKGNSGNGHEIWRAGPGQRSVIEEYRSTTSTGFGLGWWEEESAGFRFEWCSDDDPHGCTRL